MIMKEEIKSLFRRALSLAKGKRYCIALAILNGNV